MKKVVSMVVVLAMIICLLPTMTKEAKAGQYDYTLRFEANGGHIGSTNGPGSKTVTLSQSIYSAGLECSASRNTAYKTGYTFLGWFDANGKQYQSGVTGSPSVVYAHWQKVPTYSVNYNVNGGLTSTTPASQTKIKNVTLKLTTTCPSMPGATFVGWATKANATTATYGPGANYTANKSITLYAVYQCTVKVFDSRNGKSAVKTISKVPHKENLLKVLNQIAAPKGYTLTWYDKKTYKPIASNEIVGTGREVYYVQVPNEVNCTFVYGNNLSASGKLKTGMTCKDFISIPAYDKNKGYFVGWSPYEDGLDPNGNAHTVVYTKNYEWLIESGASKITLYAQYIKPGLDFYVDYILTEGELTAWRDAQQAIYTRTKNLMEHNVNVEEETKNGIGGKLWAGLNEIQGFGTWMAILGVDITAYTDYEHARDFFLTDKQETRLRILNAKLNALQSRGLHDVRVYTRYYRQGNGDNYLEYIDY